VYSDILHKDQAVCFLAPIDKFTYCENPNRISKQLIESNIFLVLSFVSYDKMKLFTVAVILCLQADGLLGEVCEDDEANYQKASEILKGVGRINGPADCKALAQKNPNGEGECGSDNIVGKYCRKSCGTCGADDTRQDAESCEDAMAIEKCIKLKNNGRCDKPKVSKRCMKTCGLCVGPNPASCQEKCVADWTGGTPDCIKREACQRACNAGTCPEYNK